MKRMISTKAAETAEGIKDFVKQNGKTTEFGGNVEIDGNLKVNGSAPGGASLHVYKVEGTSTLGTVFFLWTCDKDNMTVSGMNNELSYKLSSGSGFGMGIPACLETSGSYSNCIVDASSVYLGSQTQSYTISTVYKIY